MSNPASRPQLSTLNSQPSSSASAFALATLLVAGELAIWWWYVSTPRVAAVEWRAELPRTNPTFRPVELPSAALRILRFNEGQSGVWENGDGTRWQMIYLRWKPGRVAAQLARNHTPEVCLPAAGKSLRSVSDESHFEVAGLSLLFRCYTTDQNGRSLFVFYALWEDGARVQRVLTQSLTWRARFDAVLERRRNPGQRVLEIAISGARDLAQAETSLREELPHLIHLQPANRPLPTDL